MRLLHGGLLIAFVMSAVVASTARAADENTERQTELWNRRRKGIEALREETKALRNSVGDTLKKCAEWETRLEEEGRASDRKFALLVLEATRSGNAEAAAAVRQSWNECREERQVLLEQVKARRNATGEKLKRVADLERQLKELEESSDKEFGLLLLRALQDAESQAAPPNEGAATMAQQGVIRGTHHFIKTSSCPCGRAASRPSASRACAGPSPSPASPPGAR